MYGGNGIATCRRKGSGFHNVNQDKRSALMIQVRVILSPGNINSRSCVSYLVVGVILKRHKFYGLADILMPAHRRWLRCWVGLTKSSLYNGNAVPAVFRMWRFARQINQPMVQTAK